MNLPRTYDAILDRYRAGTPRPFLRALIQRESGFDPAAGAGKASSSAARGLMQITGVARDGFNNAQGATYQAADLLTPEVSIKIGADLLRRIVRSYQDHRHGNMREDWSNPEFVKLVLAGWNSGYSNGGGVGRVVSYLLARGLPVTHDQVFQNAAAAGATSHLQNLAKRDWQRGVAALYFQQPAEGSSFMTVVLLGFVALGAYHLAR